MRGSDATLSGAAGSMDGKVVVITGGRRGLGAAMASRLASEGAVVIATTRQLDKVNHATQAMQATQAMEDTQAGPQPGAAGAGEAVSSTGNPAKFAPGSIRYEALDVRDEQQVKRLMERLEAAFGRIDVWINNAGIGVFKPVVDTSVEEYERVMDTNVRGVFLCSREAFRHMRKRGGGRIINIASIAGYTPIADNGIYGASKYAVRGFSQILNEEGKACNVRVSIVSPGAVVTDIWEGREGFDETDMLHPEDIAETVLDIAKRPLHVRIDEVKIVPPKGVL